MSVCVQTIAQVECVKRRIPAEPVTPKLVANSFDEGVPVLGLLGDDSLYLYVSSDLTQFPTHIARDFDYFSIEEDFLIEDQIKLLIGDYEKTVLDDGNFLYNINYEIQ